MRPLWIALTLSASAALAQADGGSPAPSAPAASPAVSAEPPAPAPAAGADATPASPGDAVTTGVAATRTLCQGDADGLLQGPVVLGYQEADLATGRRVCPRTEVGVGSRLTAIIDTPNYYGNLGVQALVFGSWAFDEKTELFGTLEAVDYQYVQNASLIGSSLALGNLTVGGTRRLYGTGDFARAATVRLLLPTTFGTPGSRPLGLEVGHDSSWLPKRWLEVHTFLGADVSLGLGPSGALPRGGGVLAAGAQWLPLDWLGVALDLAGRLDSARSYLAPSLALRFAVKQVSIELGATLPLAGDDRHDVIGGLRLAYRL